MPPENVAQSEVGRFLFHGNRELLHLETKIARFLGRVAGVAWQTEYIPDYQQVGQKAHYIERFFRATKLSRAMLRASIPDSPALVGVGKNSIVMRTGQTVQKYSIPLAGRKPEYIIDALQRHQIENDYVISQLGELAIPISYREGAFRFRASPPVNTLIGAQQYVPYEFDIFRAPSEILESPTVQNDLKQLTECINVLEDDERYLDVVGPDNIVVSLESSHESMNPVHRVRVIDTELLGPHALKHKGADGHTLKERYATKSQQLRLLAGY